MKAIQTYDLLSSTAILRGEKPGRPIEAILAANPHQSNRVRGYLPDGTRVVVALRSSKGGVDINKLTGGKVSMVAADGFQPAYEKSEDGASGPKVQKTEDGLPLFTSSGVYILSSKYYPALDAFQGLTRIVRQGEGALVISDDAIADRRAVTLRNRTEFDALLAKIQVALDKAASLFSRFNPDIDKKRRRGIDAAKAEAEDDGADYHGAEFVALDTSPRDGRAFVPIAWTRPDGPPGLGAILLEQEKTLEKGLQYVEILTAEVAIKQFRESKTGLGILAALDAGHEVRVGFARGYSVRTSVSFRRKALEVLTEAEADSPSFGDAVFIKGAAKGWVRSTATLMHSMHPLFPQKDYDVHHYVAAFRQAEVGLNRVGERWSAPLAPSYSLQDILLA